MIDERNNSVEAETDSVMPETDNPEAWDYFDPDEDNEEAPATEGTDDEAQQVTEEEADPEGEAEPEDAEPSSEDAEDKQPEHATLDALVKLADGSEVAVRDLIAGQMLKDDYSRKTQSIAEQRKAYESSSARLEKQTSALIDYIAQRMPPEPNRELAATDPAKWNQMKARYDAAVSDLQGILGVKEDVQAARNEANEAVHQQTLRDENRKLTMMFPEAGTKDGREAFFTNAHKAAVELGFSEAELHQVSDHRLYALAHWARRGLEAEKQSKAARAKVQDAPPVAPKKARVDRGRQRSADAMRKLAKSGSIEDALQVDWD